jgi:hypothetical protein
VERFAGVLLEVDARDPDAPRRAVERIRRPWIVSTPWFTT